MSQSIRDTGPRDGDTAGLVMTRLLAHVEARFEVDAQGRLRAGPKSGGTAPRFYLGRTRLGNLWRIRGDVPPEAVRALSRLAAREPALASTQPAIPPAPERLAALWAQLEVGPLDPAAITRSPVFSFTRVALAFGPGQARPLEGPEDPLAPALRQHFPAAAAAIDANAPCAVWLSAGEPTSICFTTSQGQHSPAAHEAHVITRGPFRGRRQAPAVAAAWARTVTAHGDTPLYTPPWSNRAALNVATHLGLSDFAEDLQIS